MNTKLLGLLTATTALTGIVATTGVANAATLSYTANTDFETTNIINSPLSIKKFDAELGILNSVKIDFTGKIQGDAGFESRDAKPATITLDFSGLLELKLADGPYLFNNINPKQSYSYNVTAYDKKLDFAGTSGNTVEGLMATQSASKTFATSEFLDYFTGMGDVNFLFSALADSKVTGSGNISSYVNTEAASSVKVTYNYTKKKKVPEPTTLLGIGLVAGYGFLSQKKKSLAKV
ncbi:choice-of-anchor E domain-containing protein [Iningainema tapete]|uniref:PEP-CTERM sorting domain-containing protein n=1 Tax=Iningainema tapete BLCC-T55 TaxID=2748662 RepID=A0A8J6XI63_9CYAN|nr:PEP-CTERM sorting domain-containing protein [Iningainema tapete]MBD2771874.1 PEP-CTERM sorting domain-containing protein [Iningainema tapete BLCC-T55]